MALYRLGTRVCQDIAGLPEFAREPWSSGRLEGALDYADFRVAPHHLPLVVSERPRFRQHRVRHADLADIVQNAADLDMDDLLKR